MIHWTAIKPEQATEIVLPALGIYGPINEMNEPCPWPWEPQQMGGQPIGQFHCGYCGGMQMAGIQHLDWNSEPDAPLALVVTE